MYSGGGTKSQDPSFKVKEKKINKIDVSMQFELLSYCTKTDDLEVFLPSVDDTDYDLVINTLLLQIEKERILCERNRNKSKNDQDFNRIQQLEQMKNFIYDYQENQLETEIESFSVETPKVFYTTTPSGNISLMNDLKEISKEVYPEFLTLFDSILSGNPKRPKTIDRSCKKFKNTFLQVRLNHSRMTFNVLTNDIIVVTGAFIKNDQRSNILSSRFRNTDKLFSLNKEYFLKNINNQDYISSQEKITQEVYKILRKER